MAKRKSKEKEDLKKVQAQFGVWRKNRIEENDNRFQSAPQQAAFIEFPPLGSPALYTELNLDIEKADLKIKFHLKVPFSAGGQRP